MPSKLSNFLFVSYMLQLHYLYTYIFAYTERKKLRYYLSAIMCRDMLPLLWDLLLTERSTPILWSNGPSPGAYTKA